MERKPFIIPDFDVAVHEVGHAVMCHVLSVGLEQIQLIGGGDGIVQHDVQTDPILDGLIAVAGVVAEELFGFHPSLGKADSAALHKHRIEAEGVTMLRLMATHILSKRKPLIREATRQLLQKEKLTGREFSRLAKQFEIPGARS